MRLPVLLLILGLPAAAQAETPAVFSAAPDAVAVTLYRDPDRGDGAINRGGFKVQPEEVRRVLISHPGVRDACVVGVPDARLGERACAVVVPRGDARPSLEELCDFLRERGLSTHFLPERLETVDALPKTPSGKIRKVELRDRYTAS